MSCKIEKSLLSMELFENGPVVVFVWRNDPVLSVEDVSKNIEKILGYKQEEFLLNSLNYSSLIFENDISKVKEELVKYSTNQAKNFIHEPYRVQKSNGEFIWVKDTTTIIYEDGKITHYVGYIYNCTQEMVDLKNTFIENTLANIVQNIPGMIYMYQLFPDGRSYFPYTSDKIYDFYGISPEDARENASKIFEFTHPEDMEHIIQSTKISFEELSVWEDEFRVVRPDMDIIWLKGIAKPEKQIDGSVLWCGYIFDITQQKIDQFEHNRSNALLKAIINSTPDAVFAKDTEGKFLLFNHAASNMTGKSDKEVLGNTDDVIFTPEVVSAIKQTDKNIMQNGIIKSQEEYVTTLAGKEKVFLATKGPIFDDDGSLLGIFGITRDISEQKCSEYALMKEKEIAQNYLDIVGVMILVLDNQNNVKLINKRGCEIIGYSAEEVVGKNWLENFIPKNSNLEIDVMSELFINEGEDGIVDFENIILTQSGEERLISWRKTTLFDIDGSIIGLLASGEDITDLHAFQKNLEEQKEEFEAIFKYSKDGIAIFDLNSKFLDFNDAYLEMTGFSRDELLKKSCIELTTAEYLERSKAVMSKVIEDGFIENFEKSCVVKDEKIIIINMTLSLMPDKKRIIAVSKNITHDKLIESQAKLASMGEMIGNIAHQWRQPLNVISTLASGIVFKKEYGSFQDEELIPNMEIIMEQTNYLSETIDDFRTFIKGDNAKEEIVVSLLFGKTFSIVYPSLKHYDISIITDIDFYITIQGYKNGLVQAFINIINNCKDALVGNGAIEDKYIFISAKSKENHCEITIKDNGGGIKLSIINRIFEPYFTTKHQSQGTGLGLSMANKIISEMHNGTISVSNVTYEYKQKEYTGACFKIIL